MKDPNPRNGKELGSPLDHILLDYPVSNEETVSKRYTFFHDLGSGAYATVKYGTCTKTKKPFAVKIISKTKTPKDYLRKFVPREVDALKRLSIHGHPFITQMREFFETSNRVYLVTTLAKGGDLLTYINSRKYLDEEVAKKMIAQLLCALDHIHDLGIVHRDLKCENLLIGDRDQIMVTDFGFATQQPRNRLLTTFCGSYAYAAPEILTGSSYNGKCTDVWSVGVILYAMLNGRLPYNDTKPKNIMLKIKTNPLVMVKRVSLLCEKFVRGLLTISSMDRPTVSELLLHKWLEKPMEKVLKTLPENLQPSCFKLTRRSSFRMSVSSEESPPAEIVAANSSNKTSSTISERVKRKYRQMKTDLKTWASRKRKGHVISPEGEKPGTAVGTCPPEKKHVTPQEVRLKYAFRELPSPGPRESPDRSVSAVPPKSKRRSSLDSRAKSCRPGEGSHNSGSFKTAASGGSGSSGGNRNEYSRNQPTSKDREHLIQDQILGYLAQQRHDTRSPSAGPPAKRGLPPTPHTGLPPLTKKRPSDSRARGNRPARGSDTSVRRKQRGSDTSVREEHRKHSLQGKDQRRDTYDKAVLYKHIQNQKVPNPPGTPNPRATQPGANHRGTPPLMTPAHRAPPPPLVHPAQRAPPPPLVTPTKVVSVSPPKLRRGSYSNKRPSLEGKTLDLSTVYSH